MSAERAIVLGILAVVFIAVLIFVLRALGSA